MQLLNRTNKNSLIHHSDLHNFILQVYGHLPAHVVVLGHDDDDQSIADRGQQEERHVAADEGRVTGLVVHEHAAREVRDDLVKWGRSQVGQPRVVDQREVDVESVQRAEWAHVSACHAATQLAAATGLATGSAGAPTPHRSLARRGHAHPTRGEARDDKVFE